MRSILEKAEKYVNYAEEEDFGKARIAVIGIGGAGNNTINRLHTLGVHGAETIAMNTDRQHLDIIEADRKMLLGRELTKGLGAGGDPSIGWQAAEEDRYKIKELLEDIQLVFLAAGMGGGTGTGAAPLVAQVAKELGILTIGVVTLPFKMEGDIRLKKAQAGLKALQANCDTVVALDNNKLMSLVPKQPVNYAFSVADEVLAEMVKGLSETITQPSLVNLDFADVRTVMEDGGVAMIGVGESSSTNRAEEAVAEALRNKLLDVDYTEAKGALVHCSGGPDMKLYEANRVGELVKGMVKDKDSQVIWGARIDDNLRESIRVMVIMTGVKSPWISGRVLDNDGAKISFAQFKRKKSSYWPSFGIDSF
ncbi:MAG: cell division protein FtsZ [Methanomicrobia archaeon]|nr:cell division protein FtsZ [Methanomicrobia archaeon]